MLWDFLFGTIIGWWILIILAAGAFQGVRGLIRAWMRHRRVVAANLARLSDPRNAESRFTLAKLFSEGKRWSRALALIDEAVTIASDDSRYNNVPHRFFRLKADCLYGCRDWAGAATAYRKSLEVPSDTGYAEALLGVARSEYRAGRLAEAVAFGRHAVTENESLLEAYFRWAQAAAAGKEEAERTKAAEDFHRVAAALPPFARQRRLWWRMAFLFFPIARRIG